MAKCSSIRTTSKRGVLPGHQKVYRCRNDATRAMRIHQTDDHSRVANGWFEVELCDACFFRSDSGAIVRLKGEGRQAWRWLR